MGIISDVEEEKTRFGGKRRKVGVEEVTIAIRRTEFTAKASPGNEFLKR